MRLKYRMNAGLWVSLARRLERCPDFDRVVGIVIDELSMLPMRLGEL